MPFVTTIQRDKHLHYYREKEKKSEIREHWNKGNKKVKKKILNNNHSGHATLRFGQA